MLPSASQNKRQACWSQKTWFKLYLELQGELVGRVLAHVFEEGLKVVQLHRAESTKKTLSNGWHPPPSLHFAFNLTDNESSKSYTGRCLLHKTFNEL